MTSVEPKIEIREKYAWLIIGFVGFLLVFNMFFILLNFLKGIGLILKKSYGICIWHLNKVKEWFKERFQSDTNDDIENNPEKLNSEV